MISIRLRVTSVAAVTAAALLSACAGHSPNALPPQSTSFLQWAPLATPAACIGQKNKPKYSFVKNNLTTKGGKACIPSFGGFGGSVSYPGANPAITATFTSSTTNYTHKLPALGKGTVMFYLQIALSGATTFGTNVPAGGGLAGKALKPGKTYTAFGAVISPISQAIGGCYLVAKKSSAGGVISGFGNLLKGQSVPLAVTAVVEIYSGKQTSSKC